MPNIVHTDVTTLIRELFTGSDSARLAAMLYRRFGRDLESTVQKWDALFHNSPPQEQVLELVAHGLALESAGRPASDLPGFDHLVEEWRKDVRQRARTVSLLKAFTRARTEWRNYGASEDLAGSISLLPDELAKQRKVLLEQLRQAYLDAKTAFYEHCWILPTTVRLAVVRAALDSCAITPEEADEIQDGTNR